MTSIGRPTGRFVSSIALRQLNDFIRPEVQNVYIEYLINTGDICNPVSRRGPGWGIVVASSKTCSSDVGAFCVHDVDLGSSTSIRGESDFSAVGRPGRRRIDGSVKGQSFDVCAITVGDIDL